MTQEYSKVEESILQISELSESTQVMLKEMNMTVASKRATYPWKIGKLQKSICDLECAQLENYEPVVGSSALDIKDNSVAISTAMKQYKALIKHRSQDGKHDELIQHAKTLSQLQNLPVVDLHAEVVVHPEPLPVNMETDI
uniref:Uncharacterized LOC100185703 n=1 Tax=Ciona intestinalis TaxID=7719 RepID=H2XKI6_CIOIN|nr:uncharacterized protein LOC100185703 [Ciona intestinalis]|eukprot:XP_002129297.1 uncharacterized protein LOC100185703 [Ciona intestinalis]